MLSRDNSLWISAEDIAETSTDWLWWPYIAAENVNIIAGMGNEGKGLICTHIAACVTRGRAFPLSAEKSPPSDVVWCEMEDDLGSTIKPRLKAAKADLSKVTVLKPIEFLRRSGLQAREYIGQIIEEKKPRLLILSPMNSFLGACNINSEMEVRAVFEELRSFTLGTGCAILGIAHANKKTDLQAIERISGSVAYVNFCRSVILVTAEKDGEDPQTRRFIHGKWNMSTKGSDLLYTSYYDGNDKKQRDQYVRLRWDTPLSDVDHKKAFNEEAKERAAQPVGEWLVSYLQEHGPTSVSALKDAGKRYKWGSVAQARLRLNDKNAEMQIIASNGIWTLCKAL